MAARHHLRFLLEAQLRIIHAQDRNKLRWTSRTRLHLGFFLPPQNVKLRNISVDGLVRPTVMRKRLYLFVDRVRRLWGKFTLKDFQNSRNSVAVV